VRSGRRNRARLAVKTPLSIFCALGLACDSSPTHARPHGDAMRPDEVVELFLRDRARAEERFADEKIPVHGYVDAVTRVFEGQLFVVLSSERTFRWDVVYCAPAPHMDVASIEPGRELLVHGYFDAAHFSVVTLKDCTW
jgi:hypothetical protein